MRLPRLPNSFVKARSQTVQFLGINLTENFQDGEMSDCKNLSTLQYPTLTQRKGREALEGYDNMVTDIFEWDGKLIVVSNGTLYVDGDPIASVTDTKKQFAVVNSRLVVFPDKVSIDLRNNEFKPLEVSVTTSPTAGPVKFTGNSIEAPIDRMRARSLSMGYRSGYEQHTFSPFLYTYGTSIANVREFWDETTSTWDLAGLSQLQQISAIGTDADHCFQNSIRPTVGHIFIPDASGLSSFKPIDGNVSGESTYTITNPDTSQYNDLGYVAVITVVKASDGSDAWQGIGNTFDMKIVYDVYDIQTGQAQFSSSFEVGDYVDVSGSTYGLLDTEYNGDDNTTSSKICITGIQEATTVSENKLIFADGTFRIPYAVKMTTVNYLPNNYYIKVPAGYFYTFAVSKKIVRGQVVVLYGAGETQDILIWDIQKHKFVASYLGTKVTSAPESGYTDMGSTGIYPTTMSVAVTISRSIPDLDFICERDNRLWGVSNATKTIYASALGLPWQFYDYSGLDTGAYAVAVGSAGDFTGIVDYGGVLCFKENCVHKMLGSFPSDFYMTTYNVAGIQAGAERSAVIISEILYYRSPLGVMAFTGYQPTNISPNLALENTKGGVGGTNGQEYYLCVQAKDESHHSLFKYDLQRKLWTKEEDIDVTGMANIGNDLYLTIHTQEMVEIDGQQRVNDYYIPYATGQENEEGMNLEWFAQFKPYTESEGGIRKAGYTRLVLRFDMAPGSVFKIKVRYDNGLWEDAWTQPATPKLSHTVPLRIKRCDKFELRLEGKGQTKIRSIVREFVQGGWFENGSNFYR